MELHASVYTSQYACVQCISFCALESAHTFIHSMEINSVTVLHASVCNTAINRFTISP